MSVTRLRAAAASAPARALLPQRSHLHTSTAGGLLRHGAILPRALRRRRWPTGASALHGLPAVRTISFARALPKLATKLIRIPAMFGASVVAGLAYLQYQAGQVGTWALDTLRRAGDAAGATAGGVLGSARDVAGQTWEGFERTRESAKDRIERAREKAKEKIERTRENARERWDMPAWMEQMLYGKEGGSDAGSGGEPPKQGKSGAAAAGAATGAAFGYSQSPEEDERTDQQAARDDQMMVLTRKMIEIRSILQEVDQGSTLTLPSIVVIGSQSSGKSSVLEAIVGHEFLPKGNNMVTRRPIELTLVNTPGAAAEYGEFPALGLGKITDFSQIQKTLTDLNLAVPAKDCVSDDPIRLSVFSPNVPDLSLIDLPGYIQVVGSDQPLELKQKIHDLCDRYIQAPNIILAISAADVDLANSTALRASRRVDPRGERTIGVVTKMDLVDAPRGASILTDRRYPLRLGYVGVVSRIPQTVGLFSRGSGRLASAVAQNENAYFSAHPLEYGREAGVHVGTTTLRQKLMHVLENTMAAGLADTTEAIRQELEEAAYEFKVQYNDRPLSAESYLAEALDAFKHSFKELTGRFGRPQVRELLKAELDQRVLDLLAQRYWNKPVADLAPPRPDPNPIAALAAPEAADDPYWRRQLDASTAALTKLGIGRLATTVVADALQAQVEALVARSTFAAHPFARDAVTAAAARVLDDRFYATADQVENCVKPYKFEVEVDDAEWARARGSVAQALNKELRECEAAERRLQGAAGGKRKLKDVSTFVGRVRKGEVVLEGSGAGGAGGFSAALLAMGTHSLPTLLLPQSPELCDTDSPPPRSRSDLPPRARRPPAHAPARPPVPRLCLAHVQVPLPRGLPGRDRLQAHGDGGAVPQRRAAGRVLPPLPARAGRAPGRAGARRRRALRARGPARRAPPGRREEEGPAGAGAGEV